MTTGIRVLLENFLTMGTQVIYIMHKVDYRSGQENKKPKQTNFFLENKNGVSK